MENLKTTVFYETISNIRSWLDTVPEAPVDITVTEDCFTMRPTAIDTFPVNIFRDEDRVAVSAFRWHCHYDDPQTAYYVCHWLMTPFYRLVNEQIGGCPFASWIERYTAEGWENCDTVYTKDPSLPSSWILKKDEKIIRIYAQQNVMNLGRPFEEIRPGVELTSDGLPLGSHLGFREEVATESRANR